MCSRTSAPTMRCRFFLAAIAFVLVASHVNADIETSGSHEQQLQNEVVPAASSYAIEKLLAKVAELESRLDAMSDFDIRLKALEANLKDVTVGVKAAQADVTRVLPRKLATPATDSKLESRVAALEKKVTGFTAGTASLDLTQLCIGQTCFTGGESLYLKHKTTKNVVVQVNHKGYDTFQVFPKPSDNSKWFFVNSMYETGFWDRVAVDTLGRFKINEICTGGDPKCDKYDIVKMVHDMYDNGGSSGGGSGGEITADKVCIGVTCLEADGDSLKFNNKDSGHTLAEFSHAGWDRFKVFPDDDSDNYYFFVDTSYRFGFWDEANYTPYGTCSATGFAV